MPVAAVGKADRTAAAGAARSSVNPSETETAEAPALPEAQPLGFSAKAEPSQVGLGRPFVYEIEVRHDPADTYALPRPLALGEAMVRKVESSREEQGDAAISRFRIESAVYDRLGEAALPDVVLSVKGPAGARELRIPGAPVTVISTSTGDELAGMHPAQELRVPSLRVVWIALAALLAAALGVVAHRSWRAWRARVAAAPRRPPEEVALEALAALEAEALPGRGRVREHHFRLSAIVRAFVEASGGPEALERTTGELVEALREKPLAGLDLEAFASWLERGDVVRYAGLSIDEATASADLEEARAMVRAVTEAKRAEAAREKALAAGPKGPTSAGAMTSSKAGGGIPASRKSPAPASVSPAAGGVSMSATQARGGSPGPASVSSAAGGVSVSATQARGGSPGPASVSPAAGGVSGIPAGGAPARAGAPSRAAAPPPLQAEIVEADDVASGEER